MATSPPLAPGMGLCLVILILREEMTEAQTWDDCEDLVAILAVTAIMMAITKVWSRALV